MVTSNWSAPALVCCVAVPCITSCQAGPNCSSAAKSLTLTLLFQLLAAQRVACRVLDRVRTDDARQLLVAQWRQTMSAPDWCVRSCHGLLRANLMATFKTLASSRELEDYDWRPTFEPRMREMPISRSEFCANPWNALYLSYAELVGELEQPKRVLGVLRDEERMRAYKTAIERNVKGANHDVVLSLRSTDAFDRVACRCFGKWRRCFTRVVRSSRCQNNHRCEHLSFIRDNIF